MKDGNMFDDIRPYRDSEIPAAMHRIAESAFFPLMASYIFPDRDLESVREMVKSIRTTDQFQAKVMYYMNTQVIKRTISKFTYGGLENVSPAKGYLFIANHRDIVLDSSLLQYLLFTNGHRTSEITFGANLMHNRLIVDIGKSNKMFRLERPGSNIREFYRSSAHVSEYMREAVCKRNSSVWIAQRNGRTKDGMDITDQGVIKMLGMSGGNDKIDAMDELRITPVAISYEWEPCDILKTLELYEKRHTGQYLKKPGEDINSILTGFIQQKGAVHIEICKPVSREELEEYAPLTRSDFNRAVASLIDRRIHAAYRLAPNNYIAHDLRYGKSEFAGKYTLEQKLKFERHLARLRNYEQNCDIEILADILTGIYSNPIDYISKTERV